MAKGSAIRISAEQFGGNASVSSLWTISNVDARKPTMTRCSRITMNAAEKLLRKVFRFGEAGVDVFATADPSSVDPTSYIHPDACFSLFGPSGKKELLSGRDAFLDFVRVCTEALADRADEV